MVTRLRAKLEVLWRIIRITVFGIAHASWAWSPILHRSTWLEKIVATVGSTGITEAAYRILFPQGSRRISSSAARVLARVVAWANRIASDINTVDADFHKVEPLIAKVIPTRIEAKVELASKAVDEVAKAGTEIAQVVDQAAPPQSVATSAVPTTTQGTSAPTALVSHDPQVTS